MHLYTVEDFLVVALHCYHAALDPQVESNQPQGQNRKWFNCEGNTAL